MNDVPAPTLPTPKCSRHLTLMPPVIGHVEERFHLEITSRLNLHETTYVFP